MYYIINDGGILLTKESLESIQASLNYRVSLDKLQRCVDKDVEVIKGFKLVTRHSLKFKEVKSPFKEGDSSNKTFKSLQPIKNGYDDFFNLLNIANELKLTRRYTK